MNKVDYTILGGRRIREATYKHMQDGIIEAISNMIAFCGVTAPNGIKLFGCDVTITGGGNTGEVTAGAVFIAGEVYTVDAASGVVKTGTDDFVFKVVESTSAPTLTYYDGSSVVPQLVRKATLSFEDNATSGNFMPYDADTWQERLHGKLSNNSSPTLATDGGGGVWTISVGSIQYQHNIANKLMHMWAVIETNLATASSAYLKIKLPVDQNGDQLNCLGLVSAVGLHGTDLLEITADTDTEFIRLTKNDGTSFGTGGLDVISFNITFAAAS